MATTLKARFFGRATSSESPRGRKDLSRRKTLWIVCGVAVLLLGSSALAARWFLVRFSSTHDGMETQWVTKGPLRVIISSEGNLAGANNAELKCQVAGGPDHLDCARWHRRFERHGARAA